MERAALQEQLMAVQLENNMVRMTWSLVFWLKPNRLNPTPVLLYVPKGTKCDQTMHDLVFDSYFSTIIFRETTVRISFFWFSRLTSSAWYILCMIYLHRYDSSSTIIKS